MHDSKTPTRHLRDGRRRRGFSLLVTLMMMVLLTTVVLGLLSLASVSLRAGQHEQAMNAAKSNARLAVRLALAELQKQSGDDRRVTADGAILGTSVAQPNLVGVWESTATRHTTDALEKAPDYPAWKKDLFRGWLVSHPDPVAVAARAFAESSAPGGSALLFSERNDGFDMKAALIPVSTGTLPGAIAWGISQEATKARINLTGSRTRVAANDALQAPDRPNLELSNVARHPDKGWETRGGTVVAIRQAVLDPAYAMSRTTAAALGREHTAEARAVLSDVVKGGLKTDLSLGFELEDGDFSAAKWGDVKNPFAGGTLPGGEVALYQPVNGGGPLEATTTYGAISFNHRFFTGAPPTFQSLRSYYRLYRHLYDSQGTGTAFQRNAAHRLWTGMPSPRGSEMGLAPVLDRVMFFLNVWADPQGVVNVVLTPVITLWNPYNVAIESEGYTAFPWMDFPVNFQWTVEKKAGGTVTARSWMSTFLAAPQSPGRSAIPYFFCQMTQGGTNATAPPLRMAPGEVRVFTPANNTPVPFQRTAADPVRTLRMKPVTTLADINTEGGFAVSMRSSPDASSNLNYNLQAGDRVRAQVEFTRNQHHFFVTLEDAGRLTGRTPQPIAEVQVYQGTLGAQNFTTPSYTQQELASTPQPVGVIETFHRTAAQAGQMADLVYTVHPRQRYVNAMLSGGRFAAGPNYEAGMRQVADVIGAGLQLTTDGQRSYYGSTNAAASGRDHLSFYSVPQSPMISLGAFQNADLADSAFAPGSQFGNSMASPYLARNTVARVMKNASTSGGEQITPGGLGIYDHSYLLNAALWDGYFLSSLAPVVDRKSATGSPSVYGSTQVNLTRPLDQVIRDWMRDPAAKPIGNPRLALHRGGLGETELAQLLGGPSGCRHAAAHLLVEGAFNINSTHEGAWRAMLASLREQAMKIRLADGSEETYEPADKTPAPRLAQPTGRADDPWNGFRELSDAEIETLAREIVTEVRSRGPFQSLGEFVNRRLSADDLGLRGALQAAIDRANLNRGAKVSNFDTTGYPNRENIPTPDTGTGTPGWLMQADLLNSLAPVITVRSDTFTIRGYGESCDPAGKVIARVWCEAVVQRVPEWLDPADQAIAAVDGVGAVNRRFGRRFEIVSQRFLTPDEVNPAPQ